MTGLSPLPLYRKLKDMVTLAFSTSSSAATIPVTLVTTQRIGISEQISGFTIPLGATINMDGTAIMQGVATVFIANAYGIALLPTDFIMIIITATLASIGTAAVPGAGLIMLTLVLTQVGLPIEGIALILGVDRLLDMMRTTTNVMGDVIVSTIVADKTGQLDRQQYHNKDSVLE
jgi:Na+/H+-dicarboxylate symporter